MGKFIEGAIYYFLPGLLEKAEEEGIGYKKKFKMFYRYCLENNEPLLYKGYREFKTPIDWNSTGSFTLNVTDESIPQFLTDSIPNSDDAFLNSL